MLDNLPNGTGSMTSRETEVLVSSATNMENIAKAWANMVNEVRKNGTGVESSMAVSGQEKNFAVRQMTNGRKYAWVDTDIFAGRKPGESEIDFVRRYLTDTYGKDWLIGTNEKTGVSIYAEQRGRTSQSRYGLAEEYVQSDYSQWIRNKSKHTFRAKMQAAGVLKDLVKIAKRGTIKQANHPNNKDAKYGVTTYKGIFAFPTYNANGEFAHANAYDCELVVLNASDGKQYLYDIVEIKKNTASGSDISQIEAQRPHPSGNTIISNGEPDVNPSHRNSIRVSSEENARYMELANKGEANLSENEKTELRKMVADAAKRAGFFIKAFHGTKAQFNVFRNGYRGDIWFTNLKTLADNHYSGGETGNTKEVFLRMENPYSETVSVKENWDIDAFVRKAFSQGHDGGILHFKYTPDAAVINDMFPYWEEHKTSVDSSFFKASAENGLFHLYELGLANKGELAIDFARRMMENGYDYYVIGKPSQAKSAGLITCDDNGNIIPLTERFVTNRTGADAWKNADIRYSIRSLTNATGKDTKRIRIETNKPVQASIRQRGSIRSRTMAFVQTLVESGKISEEQAKQFETVGNRGGNRGGYYGGNRGGNARRF